MALQEELSSLLELPFTRARIALLRSLAQGGDGSRLEPLKKVVSEGLNSRIQAIKSVARRFRSFANHRVLILFHCGRLDLKPLIH